MTRKRYLAVAGLFAALACIGFVAIAMLPPRPGLTKANFDRIQKGMTQKQVQAILGSGNVPLHPLEIALHNHQVWHDENGAMVVGILFARSDDARNDDEEVVRAMGWGGPESILDKFRRWLHLP